MVGKKKSKWQYYKTEQFCIYADGTTIPRGFQPLSPGCGKTHCSVSCCCSPKLCGAPSYMAPKRESRGL